MQHDGVLCFKFGLLILCSTLLLAFPPAAFTASPDYILIAEWTTASPGTGLSSPRSIAADAFGNFYVADTGNHRIVKYSSSGAFKTAWGSYGPLEGQLRSPLGIAVDSVGNVYVADTENLRIEKFTSYGEFITQWPSESLYVAAAPNGDLYATTGNAEEHFSPDGYRLQQWRNKFVFFLRDVAVAPSGDVFIIHGNRIEKYTPEGDLLTAWGTFGGSSPGKFKTPSGLCVDQDGNVYVADTYNRRIQKFSAIGEFITEWWYDRNLLQDLLVFPADLAVDASGRVYVVAGSKVLVFAPAESVCPVEYVLGTAHPQVAVLRRFRDEVLAQSAAGKKLIELYDRQAGDLAALCSSRPAVKAIAEKLLLWVTPALALMIPGRGQPADLFVYNREEQATP